jgi:hypothetical protein
MSSVAIDATMTGGNGPGGFNQESGSKVVTLSSTGMTVGASASLLTAQLGLGDANSTPATPTCTWNGTSMNLAASIYQGTNGGAGTYIFTLVNPTSGNKTLTAVWGTTTAIYNNEAILSAASFLHTDTVTGYKAADTITGSNNGGANPSFTVPTDSAGASLGVLTANVTGTLSVTTQTKIYASADIGINGAASYGIGGASSNTHTFGCSASSVQAWAGIHIIAAAATTSGLLMAANQGGF